MKQKEEWKQFWKELKCIHKYVATERFLYREKAFNTFTGFVNREWWLRELCCLKCKKKN